MPESKGEEEVVHSKSVLSSVDELSLLELFGILWKGKIILFAIVFLFSVVSVFYALSIPNQYKSEILLAPLEEESGGLAAIAGQFGGLASLAGFQLGGGVADKSALAIEVMKSRDFIGEFISKNEILVPLMAAKDWEPKNDRLLLDESLYSEAERKWVREVKFPYNSEPSVQEAHLAFLDRLSISQDKQTGYVTVAFEFYSSKLAQEWLMLFVQQLNAEIKKRDVQEASKSIRFLEGQLKNTSVAQMQNVFYQLIEEQTKTMMLAEARDQYVFKIIDSPIAPERKSRPKRAFIVLVGMFLGGCFGVVILMVRFLSFKR